MRQPLINHGPCGAEVGADGELVTGLAGCGALTFGLNQGLSSFRFLVLQRFTGLKFGYELNSQGKNS